MPRISPIVAVLALVAVLAWRATAAAAPPTVADPTTIGPDAGPPAANAPPAAPDPLVEIVPPVRAPVDEPGAQLRARAANIRALLDGTLDVELDTASLFVIDLADPAIVGESGERLRALLRSLEEPPPEPTKRKRPPRRAKPPKPAPEIAPLDPAAELADALQAFLSLDEAARLERLANHQRRQAAAVEQREAASRRAARLAETTRIADQLEAFLAGNLALEADPHSLLKVDLADREEAALSATRRKPWLAPPTTETPTTETPTTEAPTAETPTAETPTAEAPTAEAPTETPDALTLAEARLDELRVRFLDLPEAARDALFETHDRRRREHEQAQADATLAAKTQAEAEAAAVAEAAAAKAALDQEAVQQISSAEAEADAAAAEREQALLAARQARTEATRILAEERARLLGIKEAQARYSADVNRRKAELVDNHERALEWRSRVTQLAEGPLFGTERETQADGMYEGIRTELAATRERLREELRRIRESGAGIPLVGEGLDRDLSIDIDRGDIPELRAQLRANEEELAKLEQEVSWNLAQGLRDDVVLLNRTRLQLLDMASSDLHDAVTGFGDRGLDQVRRELDQISVELGFHALKLPRYGDLLLERLRASPFGVAVAVFQLVILLAAISWWRKRAPRVLKWIRKAMGKRRPLPRAYSWALSTLWYVERVRRPLEMLLVLWLVLLLAGGVEDLPELMLLWIIVRWVLIGLAVILLLDAMAASDTQSRRKRSSDTSVLRIHSLRVVGISVIAVGLLLSLTSAMVGRGAIYDWAWSTCWLLTLPVALYLVHRWRPTIAERLAQRLVQGPFVTWARAQETGWIRFAAATAAAAYLLVDGVARWFMRHAGGLEATRRVLAYLFRREVAKQAAVAAAAEASFVAVDADCSAAFDPEHPNPPPFDEVGCTELEKVAKLVEAHGSTLSAVVGERGMGKTALLTRLQQRLGPGIEVIQCPEVGLPGLMERIAAVAGDATLEGPALVEALRKRGHLVIAIDDAQRLIEPAVRGLRELDRLIAFAREVGGELSWVITMGSAAWHYLQRARGERVFFEQVVTLPRWTEEELGRLVRTRASAAGIDPSFEGLLVPRQVEHLEGPDGGQGPDGHRTESSYYRLLWDFSRGNPAVVLNAFRDSLLVGPDGKIVVRMFREPPAKEIEELSLPLLFVLRAVVQLDLARENELSNATLLPAADIGNALRFCVARGYLEPHENGYRITWHWYRTITTVLQRQHLLSS